MLRNSQKLLVAINLVAKEQDAINIYQCQQNLIYSLRVVKILKSEKEMKYYNKDAYIV